MIQASPRLDEDQGGVVCLGERVTGDDMVREESEVGNESHDSEESEVV